MTDITLSISVDRTQAALRGLDGRLADMSTLMVDIGELLLVSTKERFQSGTSPSGIPWPENSPVTLARKKGTRPLIGETKRLSTEILSFPASDSLEIGSNLIYAAMQQHGAAQGEFGRTKRNSPIPWGDVPAREFLGISDQDEKNIIDTVREYLTAPFDGASA